MQSLSKYYSNIFKSLPEAAIILDKDKNIIGVNEKAEYLFDVQASYCLGKKSAVLIKSKRFEKALNKAGDLENHKIILRIKINKISKRIEITINKLSENNTAIGYIVLASDVEDILESQKRLALYYKVTKITTQSSGLEDTLYKIIKVLGKYFKWDCSIVWIANEGERIKYLTAWYVDKLKNTQFIKETKKTIFEQNEGLVGKAFASKEPRVRFRIGKQFASKRNVAAKKQGLQSAFIFPIISGNVVLGLFEFRSFKKEFPSNEFFQTLYYINESTWSYIDRRLTSKKTQESEEKYRTLVELAPDIIFGLDKNGNIESLNDTYEKLTGFKKADLIGKPITQIIHPEDRKFVSKKIENSLKNGNITPFTVKINTNNDSLVGEFRARIRKKGNKIKEIMGLIVDITALKNLERQKDLWLGIAAHELKTPLTSMKAFTQILLKKQGNPQLATILDLINKMTYLINDFLDITRIRSGTLKLEISSVEINKLVESTIKMFDKAGLKHKIEYKLHGNKNIFADEKRISQVISNLISNAIKYSSAGSVITINTNQEANNFLFSIKDRGVGIPQKELPKLFTLFYRVENNKSKSTTGLGLGLFISRTIINLHKGKIWAESKTREGTTFYFTLPL